MNGDAYELMLNFYTILSLTTHLHIEAANNKLGHAISTHLKRVLVT